MQLWKGDVPAWSSLPHSRYEQDFTFQGSTTKKINTLRMRQEYRMFRLYFRPVTNQLL
nr:MAG TPA: hypothetical protein [Caudoviricetes sp.]